MSAIPVPAPVESDSYTPPSFLVSGTFLPAEDLVRQYQVFKDATRYISAAPELVFERLMSSIAEAYNTRHHIGRPQEPGPEAQPVDTISASLEQITTSIEALRNAIVTLQQQGHITAANAAVQFRALLVEFSHSLPGCNPSVTIPAQVTVPQAEHNMRIAITFTHAGANTGVRMTIADQAADSIYDTNPPWPDILTEYPQAQWGSVTKSVASAPQCGYQIAFPQSFKKPPSVRCWLTGFETTDLPLRARVQTGHITGNGFTLNVEPPTLRSVGITWLAGLPDNQVGQFSANQSGMWAGTPLTSIGFTPTGQKTYTRLAVAITQLDIGGTPAFPVKLEPLLVEGCNYFRLTMNTGAGDKGLYLLNGAYMMM